MNQWLLNVLVSIDQFANALFGGDPDETISSRVGKGARGDYGSPVRYCLLPVEFVIDLLFCPWQGMGHCRASIELDEGSRDILLSQG